MPALTSWALLPGSGGAPMVGPEPSRVKTTDVSVPPPIGAWALKPTPTVPTSGTHTFSSQLGVTDTGALKLRIASGPRSEEHTSELQSLMRISYAVFCLKKQKQQN